MTRVGFHASHEQLGPAALLTAVQQAEAAGFRAAMCSDHIAPWSRQQGQSGHAWSWLGAAMASTRMSFGVVTAPGYRYPPAVLAQSISTLGVMFPERFWCAIGSGERLNERVTGEGWPAKAVRQRRLAESLDIITRLLGGEEVDHDGAVRVERARLWSLPPHPVPLILPALTPDTAAELAPLASGLVTVNQAPDAMSDVLRAYRDAGGRGPAFAQVHLSWAPSQAEAEDIAMDQWRTNVFDPSTMAELATPEEFEQRAEQVTLTELSEAVVIASELEEHVVYLRTYLELGFDRVYLHHVGQQQRAFINAFGAHVLPVFERSG